MATSTSSKDTKQSLWDFKTYKEHEWFRALVILLLTLAAFYLLLHYFIDNVLKAKLNYEYVKLDAEEMQQVNRIYFDSLYIKAQLYASTNSNANLSTKEEDSLKKDNGTSGLLGKDPCNCTNSSCIRVVQYLNNQFIYKIDPDQIDSLKGYLCSAPPLEATNFLNNVRLKINSNFWLIGPSVYYEIIFWSWFGVLCSLLFNLGVVGRKSTTNSANPQSVFDSSEIPYQIAKLLYAPLCTLIIVFGYNFFKDQNIVDISSSKGVIVFAFIGGFYSARLIAFLDRLKEVLLPNSGTADLPGNSTTSTVTELKNFIIKLELDPAIDPVLTTAITQIDLKDAKVTLTDTAGGEPIAATPTEEGEAVNFNVANLKPGNYTIKASWSKEVNGEVVDLKAEKTASIMSSETPITLLLMKA